MKYISEFSLNEGKEVDLENEQKNQATIKEKITALDTNMKKLDANTTRPEADKMLDKAKMIGTKAKLVNALATSMQKESQLMMAVAQLKKKA